jgi:hypothetical protein
MECGAECNQVFLGVLAGVAPKLFVVTLKIRHRATAPLDYVQRALSFDPKA